MRILNDIASITELLDQHAGLHDTRIASIKVELAWFKIENGVDWPRLDVAMELNVADWGAVPCCAPGQTFRLPFKRATAVFRNVEVRSLGRLFDPYPEEIRHASVSEVVVPEGPRQLKRIGLTLMANSYIPPFYPYPDMPVPESKALNGEIFTFETLEWMEQPATQ